MTEEALKVDKQLEKAKDRLARAVVHLEDSVKKRVSAQPINNIVSSELIRALQEEVQQLRQDNKTLLQQVEEKDQAITSLKQAGNKALHTLDHAIEDLVTLSHKGNGHAHS